MLKLAKSPTYWAKAAVDEKTEDGQTVEIEWEVKFKRLLQTDIREAASTAVKDTDFEALKKIIVDWRGILDEEDREVPFSDEALKAVIERGYAGALFTAFTSSQPRAKAKN
jgi:hypothetical protein